MSKRIATFPYVIITAGIIFLLQNLDIVNDAWKKLWPLLIIVIGVVYIINRKR